MGLKGVVACSIANASSFDQPGSTGVTMDFNVDPVIKVLPLLSQAAVYLCTQLCLTLFAMKVKG